MNISMISREQLIDGIQWIGAISAIGGGVTAVAYAIIGQNCTYPCTVMVLGAWTWLSISAGKCSQEKLDKNKPQADKKSFDNNAFNEGIDILGDKAKQNLKIGAASLIDTTVSVGKAALVILCPSVQPIAESGGKLLNASAKGLSDKSIDFSVDSSKGSAKKCIEHSLT